MSTPFEALGYKPDDLFRVHHHEGAVSSGATAKLYKDDGTETPLFEIVEGTCTYNNAGRNPGLYLMLEDLEKIL